VLAALDTIPAAIALWVLIPADLAPSLFHVIPVYLAALGLGLISSSPGGLGVLELTCLMALPVLPPEQLVAALIAYRGIYFGVPAVIAAAMLVAKELQKRDVPIADQTERSGSIDAILAKSTRADVALAHLGDKSILFSDCGQGCLMYAASGNSLICLSDPIGPNHLWSELTGKFDALARSQMVTPSYYKNAGHAPTGIYAQVSRQWAHAKGGERGFSMGFFKPDYIARFASIEARKNGETIGFLTIWTSGDGQEHGLDVMRLINEAPDGTMHALVDAAIERAKGQGAERFSLCAVPFMLCDEPRHWVEQALTYFYDKKPHIHGSTGLYRFKNAFRPVWEPRFGAAPSVISAILAARDVNALIGEKKETAPPPLDQEEDEFEFNVAAA